MTRDLVILPATVPGDATYGSTPDHVADHPDWRVHQVRFPRQVWYNAAIRRQAADQIRAMRLRSFVLVGFSKSGLGAINLMRELGDSVAATIVFDAPVARSITYPGDAADFYADDRTWRDDLPLTHAAALAPTLGPTHRLILISGANFHDEMATFSHRLTELHADHTFLPRPRMAHHWQAGWLSQALSLL
ncbi:MAG: hypothetical protein WC058_10195 [Phycisphaeraceae bacterium]